MSDKRKQEIAGVELHSRAVRGESLSVQEQEQLNAWYAEQDRLEAEELGFIVHESPTGLVIYPDATNSVQNEIDNILTRIEEAVAQIRVLATQNESLRQEVDTLRKKVADRTPLQPA